MTRAADGNSYSFSATSPSDTLYEDKKFGIPCLLTDQRGKTNAEFAYFTYTDNLNPVVTDISNDLAIDRSTPTKTVDFSTVCTDPEGLGRSYTFTVNGTDYNNLAAVEKAWFTYSGSTLSYSHTSNANGGTHTIVFTCKDNF